jgi:hypothetical protein
VPESRAVARALGRKVQSKLSWSPTQAAAIGSRLAGAQQERGLTFRKVASVKQVESRIQDTDLGVMHNATPDAGFRRPEPSPFPAIQTNLEFWGQGPNDYAHPQDVDSDAATLHRSLLEAEAALEALRTRCEKVEPPALNGETHAHREDSHFRRGGSPSGPQ